MQIRRIRSQMTFRCASDRRSSCAWASAAAATAWATSENCPNRWADVSCAAGADARVIGGDADAPGVG